MTRAGKWIALVGVPLLLVFTVQLPFVGEAAETALCDANPKAADLRYVLKDISGKDFNLASQKGKVILLDFWATWCAPCKVEIPWFVEFQTRYGPKGFTVVGVSVDDPPEKLKPFVQQFKMNYPVLVGDGREDLQGPKGYGPMFGLPKTVVIGRDGRICKAHVGFTPRDTFETQIKGLL